MFEHVGHDWSRPDWTRRLSSGILTGLFGVGLVFGFYIIDPYDVTDMATEGSLIDVEVFAVQMADPMPSQPPPAPAMPNADIEPPVLPEEIEPEPEPEPEPELEPEEDPEESDPTRLEPLERDPLRNLVYGFRERTQLSGTGTGDLLGDGSAALDDMERGESVLDPGNATLVSANILRVRQRWQPRYPAAFNLGLGDPTCVVRVSIDRSGAPYKVRVEDCPQVFHDSARDAMFKWRWYPPVIDGENVNAETIIHVRYRR